MDRVVSAKQTVVLYPGGGAGHLGPMTQLAKVFLHHGYDVTIVLLEPPIKSIAPGASFIEGLAASNPSITFHLLPPIPPPDFASATKHPFLLVQELLGQYNDKLESFLRSIPRERLHSLVIDMFCTDAINVAAKVGVPVYTFFAASAGALAVLTQTAALLAGRQTGLKELGDTPLEFLGVPPMPASHILREMLEDPEDELCKTMTEIWKRDTDTRGVLINTFYSLEGRALQAFSDPLCLLSEEQVKEIAAGLEKSGQRFLWVVRTPASDPKRLWEPRPEPDLDTILPEGFLERTRDRGLVIKSWAPQVDVLNNPAIGAFVTHCGWNSTLEAIAAGADAVLATGRRAEDQQGTYDRGHGHRAGAGGVQHRFHQG
ncbi:unnamed protein product [Miscanthus lutarioriparius]|uniref:Uncharacterized protein n=1 Tax=Miscanthus lutarioriparius TaxID=422564 RepID=A0A811P6V4_9POAL|nr:unnamed protein product [Miscanthus lutarioriparius]